LRGATKDGELWAIGGLPRATEDFKLVLRVTGSGDISVAAISPDGTHHEPLAVERHSSSNFDRPGDEWGVFFHFDREGCWKILVERGDLTGEITLAVRN